MNLHVQLLSIIKTDKTERLGDDLDAGLVRSPFHHICFRYGQRIQENPLIRAGIHSSN